MFLRPRRLLSLDRNESSKLWSTEFLFCCYFDSFPVNFVHLLALDTACLWHIYSYLLPTFTCLLASATVNMSTNPPFLAIPREIRDLIYKFYVAEEYYVFNYDSGKLRTPTRFVDLALNYTVSDPFE